MRVSTPEIQPFPEIPDASWNKRGKWPCSWITCAEQPVTPFVAAFRRTFHLAQHQTLRIFVSADERYELYLDGTRLGRGPERGDGRHWAFETYDLSLSPGHHMLVARVWALGEEHSPYAQMSICPGFLLAPQDEALLEELGTGVAQWEGKLLGGYHFTNPMAAWGTGSNLLIQGDAYDWGIASGESDGWNPAVTLHPGYSSATRNEFMRGEHLLQPASLPPMLNRQIHGLVLRYVGDGGGVEELWRCPIRLKDDLATERSGWESLLAGKSSLVVAPHSHRRVIVDLNDYYCAYPDVVTTGGTGSEVALHWQESLFDDLDRWSKGNRDEIDGKYFVTHWHKRDGIGDRFLPDGGRARSFSSLWWHAGRYVQIEVITGERALTIERLDFQETRYPLEMESRFLSSDARLENAVPLMLRGLQMCSHETYMDCPYYEQLMYVGDARLEALATYAISNDDRLPRKALQLFDWSRELSGLTQSRYPSRVRQMTPPFSLWWVAMVHDYAMWRGDEDLLKSLMPGVRATLDYFRSLVNLRGEVEAPEGWNFQDWVNGWKDGVPPGGNSAHSSVFAWQLALVFHLASELEEAVGDFSMAVRQRKLAALVAEANDRLFWNEERGLYADEPEHRSYSEHSQCLALLSGFPSADRRQRLAEGLLRDQELHQTTIYFSHYLFEAYRLIGAPQAIFERLTLWFNLRQLGLKTTLEMPEPSRSDCHGWGAHPLFHYHATILGVRPSSPEFASVEVSPLLGPLTWASGTIPHPRGVIQVDFRRSNKGLTGDITLPLGVTGEFVWGDCRKPLTEGRQRVEVGSHNSIPNKVVTKA